MATKLEPRFDYEACPPQGVPQGSWHLASSWERMRCERPVRYAIAQAVIVFCLFLGTVGSASRGAREETPVKAFSELLIVQRSS